MAVVALTHVPSPRMDRCVRTYASYAAIDHDRALHQHEEYRRALARAGADVRLLAVSPDEPDAVFIEDTAVVLDEIAVVTAMGAPSRRGEPDAIAAELAAFRPIVRIAEIDPAASIEGGDVIRLGRTLLVGLTARTNAAGAAALSALVRAHGYEVRPVEVTGCLHLKSACTALPDGSLLANRSWLGALPDSLLVVSVAEGEPAGANVVVVGDVAIASAAYPRTAERIAASAREVLQVDLSEFAKADGSATCLSLVFAGRSAETG